MSYFFVCAIWERVLHVLCYPPDETWVSSFVIAENQRYQTGFKSLLFFLLSNMFDKSAKLGIRRFLFTFFALQGTSYPAPAYHGAGGGTMRNGYDEAAAVAYARRWALLRNPAYLDFHGLGGDCTNFVSQWPVRGRGRDEPHAGVWLVLRNGQRTHRVLDGGGIPLPLSDGQ